MRFYRPTIKQPVSTFVEAPLEFMQGVMEKDQDAYNKADTVLKDQGKLLDQVVVHELYKEEKNKRVAEYQKALEKVTNELQSTGDVSKASRDYYSIQSQLSKDTFLKDAPAYSKTLWDAEKEVRDNKENVASYNNFFNPWMQKYSKNWRNPDGSIVAPNAGQLFEKNLDFQDKAKSMMADIKASGYLNDFDNYDPTTGTIINTKTGNKAVTSDRVIQLAQMKAVDFLKTPEGTQFMRMTREMYPEIDDKQMINEGMRYLFTAGSNQIHSDVTQGSGLSFVSDDAFARMGSNNNTNQYQSQGALQAFDLEGVGSQFNPKAHVGEGFLITPSQSQLDDDPALAEEYRKFKESNNAGYNTFSELDAQGKTMLQSYFDNKEGEGYVKLRKKVENGTASQGELKAMYDDLQRNFIPKFNTRAKQNAVSRTVASTKNENQMYTGVKSDDVTLANFKDSGQLPKSTKVIDLATGKTITLGEIPGTGKEKAFVNKEFGYTSPFYTTTGGDDKFASPKQLTVVQEDGSHKTYALPNIGSPDEIKIQGAIAKNARAVYQPNIYTPSHRSGFKIKFVPLNPSDITTQLDQKEIDAYEKAGIALPGKYGVYDNSGQLYDWVDTPEKATSLVEKYANKD